MNLKKQCILTLDVAILSLRTMRRLIKQIKFRKAIDEEAEKLFFIGRTLDGLNRLQLTRKTKKSTYRSASSSVKTANKQQCLPLTDLVLINLWNARRLMIQNKFAQAESLIVATLTGRILRCLNNR